MADKMYLCTANAKTYEFINFGIWLKFKSLIHLKFKWEWQCWNFQYMIIVFLLSHHVQYEWIYEIYIVQGISFSESKLIFHLLDNLPFSLVADTSSKVKHLQHWTFQKKILTTFSNFGDMILLPPFSHPPLPAPLPPFLQPKRIKAACEKLELKKKPCLGSFYTHTCSIRPANNQNM